MKLELNFSATHELFKRQLLLQKDNWTALPMRERISVSCGNLSACQLLLLQGKTDWDWRRKWEFAGFKQQLQSQIPLEFCPKGSSVCFSYWDRKGDASPPALVSCAQLTLVKYRPTITHLRSSLIITHLRSPFMMFWQFKISPLNHKIPKAAESGGFGVKTSPNQGLIYCWRYLTDDSCLWKVKSLKTSCSSAFHSKTPLEERVVQSFTG